MARFEHPRTMVGVGTANTWEYALVSNRLFYTRWVPPRNLTVTRFLQNFTWKGLSWYGGSHGSGTWGYSNGDGGKMRMRVCRMDPDTGRPDFTQVLRDDGAPLGAQDLVNRTRTYFGSSYGSPSLDFIVFEMITPGTSTLEPLDVTEGVPLCVVFSNSHATPSSNYGSIEVYGHDSQINSAQKGNHFGDTPPANVSMNGLDHREHVATSENGGTSWVNAGPFAGSDGAQNIWMPSYGWVEAGGARKFGAPYQNYLYHGRGTTYQGRAKRTVDVTHVHAVSRRGFSAGTVTVRNITTATAAGRVGVVERRARGDGARDRATDQGQRRVAAVVLRGRLYRPARLSFPDGLARGGNGLYHDGDGG